MLGALENEEVETFRAHLASCAVCRDEVSAFQDVADALPLLAPPQPVPRGLKRKVMASIRAEPRVAEQRAPEPRRRRRPWLAPAFRSAIGSPALAASVLVLALAAAAGVVALSSSGSSTRTIQANVTWRPGNAQLRVKGGRGELILNGMPAPPANKVYEVWVKRPRRAPTPTAALFSVTSSGVAAVDVPGNLRGGDAVLVTPERKGGSAVPTHTPIVVAQVS